MKELTPARERKGVGRKKTALPQPLSIFYSHSYGPGGLSTLQGPIQCKANASHSPKAFSYSLNTL